MLIDQVSRRSYGGKAFCLSLAVDPQDLPLRGHLLRPLLSTSTEQKHQTCAALGGTRSSPMTHQGERLIFKQLCEKCFCFPDQSCCRNWPLTNAVPVLWSPEGESFMWDVMKRNAESICYGGNENLGHAPSGNLTTTTIQITAYSSKLQRQAKCPYHNFHYGHQEQPVCMQWVCKRNTDVSLLERNYYSTGRAIVRWLKIHPPPIDDRRETISDVLRKVQSTEWHRDSY